MGIAKTSEDDALKQRIEDSITDEQVKRVLLPVIAMIREGRFKNARRASRETKERHGDTGMKSLKRREETAAALAKAKRNTAVKQLVKKAMKSDRRALSDLCAEIAKDVLFGVKRLLPGYRDAEDIAQNVLIRICENIRGLKDPEGFYAWMNRIVLNETRRHLASNAKYTGGIIYMEDYTGDTVEEDADFLPHEYSLRKEESGEIMELIDALPDRQREAVLLHYYQGMNVTETAEIMEIAQPVVSKYLRVARKNIRERMLQKSRQAGDGLGMIAMLPIGPTMQAALRLEAAQMFAESGVWAKSAAAACAPYIKANSVTRIMEAVVRSSMGRRLIAGAAAAFIAVPAVVMGLTRGGKPAKVEEIPAAAPQVAFSGGDATYAHLNPRRAEADITSEYGELKALGWEITEADSGSVLYSGEGAAADEELLGLRAGTYRITFTLEDEAGRVYRSFRNFQIRSE